MIIFYTAIVLLTDIDPPRHQWSKKPPIFVFKPIAVFENHNSSQFQSLTFWSFSYVTSIQWAFGFIHPHVYTSITKRYRPMEVVYAAMFYTSCNFKILCIICTTVISIFIQLKVPLPWASGLPVAIQWQSSVPGTQTPVYTGMPLEKCQCASSGVPVAFQWSSSVFQLCKLTRDRHWDTTGC